MKVSINHCFYLVILTSVIFLIPNIKLVAQNNSQQDNEYRSVIENRATKILVKLSITDSTTFFKVRDIIASQYIGLKNIHERRENQIKEIKEKNIENKTKTEEQLKSVQKNTDNQLDKLHKTFLSNLSKHLSPAQIEKVKDGMTYGVLPITYKAYLEMIPRLTAEERKYIYDALVEAREHAMDAESSEKKHAWFGKYKGRINNYLSARGYDMNKESKDWQERIKQQQQKK
ncbi:MAG TPA: DUF3826 domain-containing protein [Niabella sp.]|jgi:hypothetical protein|nr:DUF3826 domain-containing protein [Chitinophagaceae bacterium]HRN46726.1 DUF3826 domain-containing protein [Niabella sp.]HRO83507.1 DUF3826 domain-containing protein [Niabella sp.]HUN02413.1 DUF3826 domain-containing protein [Niabella sp.]